MGWEYHTSKFNFDREAFISQGGLFNSEKFTFELNRLGWDGWELVSVAETNDVHGSTNFIVAIFKRPLTDQRRAELTQGR